VDPKLKTGPGVVGAAAGAGASETVVSVLADPNVKLGAAEVLDWLEFWEAPPNENPPGVEPGAVLPKPNVGLGAVGCEVSLSSSAPRFFFFDMDSSLAVVSGAGVEPAPNEKAAAEGFGFGLSSFFCDGRSSSGFEFVFCPAEPPKENPAEGLDAGALEKLVLPKLNPPLGASSLESDVGLPKENPGVLFPSCLSSESFVVFWAEPNKKPALWAGLSFGFSGFDGESSFFPNENPPDTVLDFVSASALVPLENPLPNLKPLSLGAGAGADPSGLEIPPPNVSAPDPADVESEGLLPKINPVFGAGASSLFSEVVEAEETLPNVNPPTPMLAEAAGTPSLGFSAVLLAPKENPPAPIEPEVLAMDAGKDVVLKSLPEGAGALPPEASEGAVPGLYASQHAHFTKSFLLEAMQVSHFQFVGSVNIEAQRGGKSDVILGSDFSFCSGAFEVSC